MQDIDCDFYAISCHKMYGPTGLGILYAKKKWLEDLPPYQGGGGMIKEVKKQGITYGDLPNKYEAWTNMKKNKKGIIIFVSSRSGIEGFENESAYCASKHGLEGLMKSLAIEGSKNGIQVFTVTPGMFMKTPMSEQNYDDVYKKKWVDPIELTPAFLKLASGRFNNLSGSHVNAWNLSREEV